MTAPHDPSRRICLQTLGAAVGVLHAPAAPAATTATLNWSNWDANAHAHCLAPFTAARHIAVRRSLVTGADNQFATLMAGGGREWDAIAPNIETVGQFIRAGLLQKIDLARLPNAAAMYPTLRDSPLIRDGKDVYALPYVWGLNPLVYRADHVKGLVDYDTLFDPKYKGRIATWDYPLSGIGIAAMHLGIAPEQAFDLGARDLAQVRKVLLAQKPLIRAYWKNLDEINRLFESGEVVVAYCWRNPYDRLKDRLPMRLGTPAQGALGWCSCLALPKHTTAQQVERAYRFADFLIGERFSYCMGTSGPYAGVNSASRTHFTPEQRRSIFIDNLAAIPTFLWPKAPDNYADWIRIWEEVKAS